MTSSICRNSNQTPPMQQQQQANTSGETTRSIMKNRPSSTSSAHQVSYYEATNMSLWKKQDEINDQSPKSTSSSQGSSSLTNQANNLATGTPATASSLISATVSSGSQQGQPSQKPKVRFNLDINYEKEREWNRVNKIIVDASKSEIEWTQEVEV